MLIFPVVQKSLPFVCVCVCACVCMCACVCVCMCGGRCASWLRSSVLVLNVHGVVGCVVNYMTR